MNKESQAKDVKPGKGRQVLTLDYRLKSISC